MIVTRAIETANAASAPRHSSEEGLILDPGQPSDTQNSDRQKK
jgi:hypothetical protein